MVDIYRIRVKGHLDDARSADLGGLRIANEPSGEAVLWGPIVDQAALHGVLARIRDLGLPLLAVNRDAGEGAAGARSVSSPPDDAPIAPAVSNTPSNEQEIAP